ncbi:MAG TPA: endo-1,4-beta-xylanase, partial [Prolixibacteraceae bacterium]|nr:endo-1,4-beta-xylanase [Prolixibacteraceae bacterium]
MLKIYPLIIILLFPHLLFAQNEIPKGELVWSDDFDGSGIPDPAKWDRPQYNRRNNNKGPDGWWSNEDSYLDGEGNLVIRVRKINNKNGDDDPYDYSVGALRTKGKFEKLYGVFEIRCQLPTQKGWWIAFWMMQGNVGSETNGGVDGSEVDIMEGFGWTDKINQAIHWDGYADAHKSIGKKTDIDNLHEGFHTYTMVWNPDEYIFYIDGIETWRTQGGGVCNRPGYLKITGELSTESWAINDYWANDPEQATYPDHFMVDYVKVYELPSEEVPPIRELVEQCYPENNLVVGAACHAHYLGTQTEEILNREFSYVTPANDFKQSYIHPEPGKWNWERSDKWVNHCRENDQLLRLHAPISPQCSQWAKDDSRTPEELEQNLTEYMTMLCKRYNDSSHVKWLDVVNETVFHADGRWFGPEDGSDNWNNPWPRIGFDEAHELRPPLYIKKAFEIANEHGSNFKLIINQHGGMEPFIWDKIKSLVGYLRENNLRVDGIGWQAHIWMGWEKEAGNLERLSELIDWCHQNDLEFHITEFNVWLKPGDLDKLKEQANTFYAITKLAAEKQKNGFVGINYWHIRGIETQNKDRDGGPWAENYEPKEAYFRIKEALCEASPECRGECGPEKLSLVIDTFNIGTNKNLLAGEWESYSDANSVDLLELDNQDGFEGTTCAKFKWTLKKGAVLYPYSMMQTWFDSEKKSIDLSDFHALKFDARGHGLVNVGMVTQNVDPDNYFFKTIALADEWKTFEIAISDLKQKDSGNTPFDIENVLSLLFGGNGDFNEPGEMWIDNIQLINEHAASEKEEPVPMVFHQPKINQTGYLLNSFKEFSVVADSVSAGESFFVINESGEEIYSGNLNSTPVDDSDISGEAVFKGDFSNLTTEGEFRIKVGNKTSFPFEINAAVYDSVLFNTLRAFYLMRANDEINDPITGLHHPGAHQSDATVSDGQGNL